MSSSIPMLLGVLFDLAGKSSNRRSQMFFKTGVHKNFAICVEASFSKVSGLKACIFIQKETPTQVFFFKYCEIFRNGFFIEDLFIYLSEILFDDRQLIF